MYGVGTAIRCRPYYTLGSHQADLPDLPQTLAPPRGRKTRYLCTKSSIINTTDGKHRYIYHHKYAVRKRVNEKQDHIRGIAF